jgi:transposase
MKNLIRSATTPEGLALDSVISNRNTPQRIVLRAKIVRDYLGGRHKREISRLLGVSRPTIDLWLKRYRALGVDGLLRDAPRPGRHPSISPELEERVVQATLHEKPANATHWSVRTMAEAHGLSRMSVQRIWKKYQLKPHRTKTFKLSKDPRFVEKVRDVVGLYLNPPDKALVLCVDEKSQIQALDRTQPGLPLKKGRLQTMTHDYKRHGTTTLFSALNMLDGKVIGECHPKHRQEEFLAFMETVDRRTPRDEDIHVILDNYGSHKTERVKKWLEEHPRFHFHFTPTSASWLNMVERFFSHITQKMIRRGVFHSVPHLIASIMDFLRRHNEKPTIFKWHRDADTILEKVENCKEALGTLH